MQLRIAKAFRLDRLDGRKNILAVDAGPAVAQEHMTKLLGERQPSRILHVAAIDHVSERADALPRVDLEPQRPRYLRIEGRQLLALGQLGHDRVAALRRSQERDPA